MEVATLARWMALISSLLLTLTITPVHSRVKCKGLWRRHSCFGGNGKRASPTMSGPSRPTVLDRQLQDATRSALRSVLQSGYQPEPRSPMRSAMSRPLALSPSRLIGSLLPRPSSPLSLSDKLLAKELAYGYLQDDDSFSREEDFRPVLVPSEDREGRDGVEEAEEAAEAAAIANDFTDVEEPDITRVDVETLRDILTALTLQQTWQSQRSHDGRLHSSDQVVL